MAGRIIYGPRLNFIEGYNSLVNLQDLNQFSFSVQSKLAAIIALLVPLNTEYNDLVLALADQYGEKVSNQEYNIPDKFKDEFADELDQINAEQVQLELVQFSQSTFKDAKLNIGSLRELRNFGFLIA